MTTDLRLLTVEQITSALAGGVGTTVVSESGHGWTLRTIKAGGPDRAKSGGSGWLRLRFEAIAAPVSQVLLLDLSHSPACEPTVSVDD